MNSKKLALAVTVASVLSAPAMAADWFIGGGVGAQQNTYKGAAQGVDPEFNNDYFSTKERENDAVYEVRAGAYLNDNNRVYTTYSYNSDDLAKQQSLLLSYDYLLGLDASNKLNWFVGATAGVNHVNPDTSYLSSKDRFVWGGQTGLMYKINDNLSSEIGYRYLKQDYDAGISTDAGSASFSLDDSQQVYLSVDYRF